MSAFVVGKPHIDAMIRLGLSAPQIGPLSWFDEEPSDEWTIGEYQEHRRRLTLETASEIGSMLWRENVRSIHYRYPDTVDGGTYPGPCDFDAAEAFDYTYRAMMPGRAPTAVEGLKLTDCYEYQTCEHPEWRTSEAFRFCAALRDRLIGRLDGYSDAPWEWTGAPLVTA